MMSGPNHVPRQTEMQEETNQFKAAGRI